MRDEANIESKRLILEPLTVGHAEFLYEGFVDERLYRFIPQDPPESVEQLEARYRQLSSGRSPDGTEIWLNFAVRLKDTEAENTNPYAGTLEATVMGDLISYIAYFTFRPYWNRGYATEGCRVLLRHLKHTYGVREVIAEIDTRNAASVALVETLGFVQVNTTFDADHFNGSSSDEYRYELKLQ